MSGRVVRDGKRYSPFDPDEVHADLRTDPATAMRSILLQPAVVEAHRDCSTCLDLTRELAPETSRRAQLRISIPQLATALRLPHGIRVARMFVSDDPQVLHVVIEGDALDEVPLIAPTPVVEF
ncbi:hypothetical protein ACIBTV_27325 [Micromonospora sp. NPDC049366]|uniref:hypothetical protein n=1 Tax=Micromonospora sp. NPDC049366 TaxID=3364271 RepID=UPI0037A1D76A